MRACSVGVGNIKHQAGSRERPTRLGPGLRMAPSGPPTSSPSKAETHASEASQMAVRSWPPSRARMIRPLAKPISCFVRYPKPATGNGRCKWRAGGSGAEAGSRSKHPETHYITLQTQGAGTLRA